MDYFGDDNEAYVSTHLFSNILIPIKPYDINKFMYKNIIKKENSFNYSTVI